jgi:hypothetical protein
MTIGVTLGGQGSGPPFLERGQTPTFCDNFVEKFAFTITITMSFYGFASDSKVIIARKMQDLID